MFVLILFHNKVLIVCAFLWSEKWFFGMDYFEGTNFW